VAFSNFASGINNVYYGIQNLPSKIGTYLDNLGNNIMGGLSDLFVPDTTVIDGYVSSIQEKFAFVDSIKLTIDSFMEFFKGDFNTPPNITVNLSSAKGRFKYGTTAKAIDLSWYAPYKPTVDKVIIGFAYGGFFWIMFMRLPDIISGSGALVVNATKVQSGEYKKMSRRGGE
jgi:cellulose synthase/poly-beta-1,6-N-acetylglucosamine synthase-like glycosyltransferase